MPPIFQKFRGLENHPREPGGVSSLEGAAMHKLSQSCGAGFELLECLKGKAKYGNQSGSLTKQACLMPRRIQGSRCGRLPSINGRNMLSTI